MPKLITRVRWGAQNLPYGVSFDETTGTFSGTPEEKGNYTVPVTVETNYGICSEDVNISVKSDSNVWTVNTIAKINNIQFVSSLHSHRMYFVDNVDLKDTTYYGQFLVVPLRKADTYNVYWLITKDLTRFIYSENAYLHLYSRDGNRARDYCLDTRRKQLLCCIGTNYIVKINPMFQNSSALSLSSTEQGTMSSFCALCYSPTLDFVLISNPSGKMMKTKGNIVQDNRAVYSSGMAVNEACLKWSEDKGIFCLAGSNGTAISTDGENWTKNTETAPKDLMELTWRDDLGKFFAWSESEKLFYVSSDGLNWEQFNNTPIPLETVKGVRYSKELGKYCAFPSSGQYVYFSKDLENWKQSDVVGGEIGIADIIYFPPVNKWVLMPTGSTTTFYTSEE